MQTVCQNCKNNFEIEEEDLNFYKKINVPPPTFCFTCRLARKLIWRNERSLYKRKCDLCQKDIISMYKESAEFPVYCHECYWSDKWNPLDYGQSYDAEIPFFKQFAELQKKVPRPAVYESKSVNSPYCNYATHNKGCFLLFGSWFSENSGYGQTIMESKDCWDCAFVKKCELCYMSHDLTQCNQVFWSGQCSNCIDSAFLYDCRNCQNCLFSYNLRNKNYYVWNKQVSREEFNKIKQETFSSYSNLEKAFEDFRKTLTEKAIHKFMNGERNHDVSGDLIYGSKNVHKSYYINEGENEKYAVRGGIGQKDTMDGFGVHSGELSYECNNIDFSSRCFFSMNGENNMDTSYLMDCNNLSHSFGCISVRKKEYCILNKQYTKEEYEKLVKKIIEGMSSNPYITKNGQIYKYGEFFPFELSPHSYNETLAQEYVPVSKERAKDLGYAWDNIEEKSYVPTKSWKDLPETTTEVDDSILSEIILCEAWDTNKDSAQNHKCTKAFRITANELMMYKKWNIPIPRKCPNTRNFELSKQRNGVNFFQRSCMCDKENHPSHDKVRPCPNKFETTYSPDKPEIVYCETCYQQEVS
jgi:hypothetical protein